MLDGFRYYIAFLTLATLPFAVLYWYAVHPFAEFWRARGGWLVAVMATGLLAVNIGLAWVWREPLLATSYPVGPPHWIVAALLYVGAIAVERACRRHLSFRILVGAPELDAEGPGELLQEGIYGRIRHPRYVAVWLGTIAAALFCNYLSLWIATVLLFPVLYGIVLLEERELIDRFGDAYRDYASRVPRFIPRFG
jgi:protein-S-isoprenylcysteine O-methyltransferase Ste14